MTRKRMIVIGLIVANEIRGLCVAVPIAWAIWGRH